MSRRSRLFLFSILAGGAFLLLLLLLAVTPAGVWTATRLAGRLAAGQGWKVAIDRHTGSLLQGFVLEGVAVDGQAAGVQATIERLEVSRWARQVRITRPQVRIELGEEEDEEETQLAAEEELLRLPLEYLPELLLGGGEVLVEWPDSGQRLELTELHAEYQPAKDASGRLTLAVPRFAWFEDELETARGKLEMRLSIEASSVAVDWLEVLAEIDTLQLTATARGRLDLSPGLPLALELESGLQTPSTEQPLSWQTAVQGRLEPLELSGRLAGQAQHPAWPTISLAGLLSLDAGRVALDSLWIDLLDGRLEGRVEYLFAADSLLVEAQLQGLDWALLVDGMNSGPASGRLHAALNLAEQRYEIELELMLRQFELLSGQFFDIQLKATQHADRQTRVTLSSPLLELTASGWLDLAGVPDAGSYDLALAGILRPEALIDREIAPVRIEGRGRPDLLQMRLTTPNLPGELGKEFGELILNLELLDYRRLDARLSLEQGLLQFEAQLDLVEATLESLTGSLAALPLGRLAPGLQGEAHGQVQAAGGLEMEDLHFSAQFEVLGLVYENWRTGPVNLTLDYREGVMGLALDGSGLHLEARLDTTLKLSAQAVFDGALLYHREEGADFQEAARLSGTVVWQGNLEQPAASQARLELDELSLSMGEWEVWAHQPVVIEYQEERVLFERLELQTSVGPVTLEGSIHADSLDLRLTLLSVDLGQLAPGATTAGEGWLQVSGPWQRPRAQSELIFRQIHLDTLSLGDAHLRLALADSLELHVELFQQTAETPAAELSLVMPATSLFAGFTDQTAGAAVLHFAAHQVDLTAVFTQLLDQSARGWLALEGELSVPLASIDSTLSWRDLRSNLILHGLELATEMDGTPFRLEMTPGSRLRIVDDQLSLQDLELRLERYDRNIRQFLPAGRLALEGSLQETAISQLNLSVEDLDLLVFNGPEGTVRLQALISGTLRQPELETTLEVQTQDLGELRGRFTGSAEGGQWSARWTTPEQDSLVVRGALPWDWESGTVDDARGWTQLYSAGIGLSFFSDQLAEYEIDRLDGRVTVDLRVDGFDESMRLDGELEVEDLSFSMIDIHPVYRFPQGRLLFRDQKIELIDFVSPATRENGRMELSGVIDLSVPETPNFAVRFETRDLAFRYDDIFRTSGIDLVLALEGTPLASRLNGSVRLKRGLAEPMLVVLNTPPVPPPPPTLRDEFLENMALQILVDIRDLKIDSELAQVEVSGAIDIGGTFYKPIFQGGVEIDAGQVILLNRLFEFQRGRIVLNNLVPTHSILEVIYDPLYLNPELDMIATSKVMDREDNEEYTVTLSLQGTARNPAPEFYSAPALDFNGIFRLLAFGSASSQLEYGAALGTAAGQLLGKRVEKAGLDEFIILPSGTVVGTAGQPTLRMGKYLDGIPLPLWVRYEAAIREMSSGEVRLEHKLNSYLTISSSAQSRYDRYGLGIGLKKDF